MNGNFTSGTPAAKKSGLSLSGSITMEPIMLRKTKSFHRAVRVLNTLQSNVLERQRRHQENPAVQLKAMHGLLHRTGLSVDDLDKLNIIHVTGTKGKGSTCAFTERILRNYGFRTGFYSSPHLVHVRERIRINGQPISRDCFAKYFWEAYERLDVTKDIYGGSMPFYFQFLTLLAFHVFLRERVDLAVIEVGIGGEYDCTNIIRKPWVCGISSLGIDHSSLLGDTMEKIAWQKAGIFKPGVPAFTVRQPPSPMEVLQDRAEEKGCPLLVCPELDEYEALGGPLHLSLVGDHQRWNASLALQLSYSWLQRQEAERKGRIFSTSSTGRRPGSRAAAFQPSTTMCEGLQETEWLGRNQTVRHGPVTYYIDGAHTKASMQICVHWFQQEMMKNQSRGSTVKVLLFNTSGGRDSAALLKLLVPCQFDYAVFCPNIPETLPNNIAHQDINVSVESMLDSCLANQSSWKSLSRAEGQFPEQLLQHQHHRHHLVVNSGSPSRVFPCILSALRWISQGKDPVLVGGVSGRSDNLLQSADGAKALQEAAHIAVLVTGSLHLVGGALQNLDPSLAL
ncbi:folylpolyglutamate synthase, mitochondrial isoform X2 [Lampris incognitus]|uniref:folylpolyglutamate synthase, mitochondrial isoform X2 n=1 Tax=Lampris incognitus TaxID=2546036 RepID=UPI0024B4A794|nr:folylpolyglutamate synthase, mitochondrial isoform X2 [Lampris incognitus]